MAAGAKDEEGVDPGALGGVVGQEDEGEGEVVVHM